MVGRVQGVRNRSEKAGANTGVTKLSHFATSSDGHPRVPAALRLQLDRDDDPVARGQLRCPPPPKVLLPPQSGMFDILPDRDRYQVGAVFAES